MNYTAKKIFILLFTLPFIAIGLYSLHGYVNGDMQEDFFPLIHGLMFSGIGATVLVYNIRLLTKFQTQTFAWYQAHNPACVTNEGVACNACGGKRVHVRNLMKRTFHRAHVCVRCGKTLYFSPEI